MFRRLGYNGVMFDVEHLEGGGDIAGAFKKLFKEIQAAGMVVAVTTSWCGAITSAALDWMAGASAP